MKKKVPHFLLVLIAAVVVIVLTIFFIYLYSGVGAEADTWSENSLFSILRKIDYGAVLTVFIPVLVYMFLLDILTTLIKRSWSRVKGKERQNKNMSLFARYWYHYQNIHLTFILLSIFLTIAITAPSSVMNTFTAIVSISVFVSTRIKKEK